MIEDGDEQALLVRRSYFDRAPIHYERAGAGFTEHPHTISDLYMSLVRASYRVDVILEPEPLRTRRRSAFWRNWFTMVPPALIVRARKEAT